MSTPLATQRYPFPNTTKLLDGVLFPDVDLDSEDDDWNRIFIERELLKRYNAIVKSPGIVARKADVNNELFPTGITGKQIKITSGTGSTKNGSFITVPSAITHGDATTITGYNADINFPLFLALRVNAIDYAPKLNWAGISLYTRRRVDYTLEWVDSLVASQDRDIVILGKRLTANPFTFDTTEDIGKRIIQRVGEVAPLDSTGGPMFGDIDMQNLYEVLNLPSINGTNWRYNGAANKKDLIRLFAKTGYIFSLLGGVSFIQDGSNFKLKFGNNDNIKIKLFPNQRPSLPIHIIKDNETLTIPDNHVVQVILSDAALLSTSTPPPPGGGGNINNELDTPNPDLNTPVIDPVLSTFNYLTTPNNYDFHKIPICVHTSDGGIHKLVFANGVVLNLNESIDSDGKYSGFLRRDGGNKMFGNLPIEKNSPFVELQETSFNDNSNAGIRIKNGNGITILEISRVNSLTNEVVDTPLSLEVGDMVVKLRDNVGNNEKIFLFKKDGTIRQPSAASNTYDLVRLGELVDALSLKFDKSGGTITGAVTIRNVLPIFNLLCHSDSEPEGWFRILNNDGNVVSYIRRVKSTEEGYNDGDLEFGAYNRNGGGKVSAILRRLSDGVGRLEADNFKALDKMYIGSNIRFAPITSEPSQESGVGAMWVRSYVNSEDYNHQLRYGYNPSDYYSLINHTVENSNTGTITSSESAALLSVTLPSEVAYKNILVQINLSIKIVGSTTIQDVVTFRLKNQSDTVIAIFKQPLMLQSGAANPTFQHFCFTYLLGSDLNNESLKITVQRTTSSNTVTLTNDTTDGKSSLSYTVLN